MKKLIKKQLVKWAISAATVAILGTGGYKVVTWDDDRGYGVVDTVHTVDTLWFDDSLELANFGKLGKVTLGGTGIEK